MNKFKIGDMVKVKNLATILGQKHELENKIRTINKCYLYEIIKCPKYLNE